MNGRTGTDGFSRLAVWAGVVCVLAATTLGSATAGGVSGTVRDGAGTPLIGLDVIVVNDWGGEIGRASTGSGGEYLVSGLAAGDYRVRTDAGAQGWVDEWYDDILLADSYPPWQATVVSVPTDGTIPNIDFALEPGGALSGTVTAEGGTPLEMATVSVYDDAESEIRTVNTDSQGFFLAVGLPSGGYRLNIEAPWGTSFVGEWYDDVPVQGWAIPAQATRVAVVAGETNENNDASLALGAAVAGTVQNLAGDPVSGVQLYVYDQANNELASHYVSSGTFLIPAVQPGAGYVRVAGTDVYSGMWYDNLLVPGDTIPAGATPLDLVAGATNEGINFHLPLGGTITGTIADQGGNPLVFYGAMLYATNGTFLDSDYTDGAGSYALSGLVPATYYVMVDPSWGSPFLGQWFDGVLDMGAGIPPGATAVTVSSGQTNAGVNFNLLTGGTVAGTVTDDKSGQGLESVWVYLHQTNEEYSVASDSTDASGQYRITGLTPGQYYLRASPPWDSDYFGEWHADVMDQGSKIPAGASGVLVAAASTTTVDVALSRGGAIAGTITDQGGAPVVGIDVRVFEEEGWNEKASATTDANGRYVAGGLLSGSFFVRTDVPDTMNAIDEWYDDVPAHGRDIPYGADWIDVTFGETNQNVDFVLSTGAVIQGHVEDLHGGAIVGVVVESQAPDGATLRSATTDAQGDYAVLGLPAGSFFLQTKTPGHMNYADMWYSNMLVRSAWGDPPHGATWVDVGAGDVVGSVDFALPAGSQISGSISDGSYAPIGGCSVRAYDADGNQLASYYVSYDQTAYALRGLPPGITFVGSDNWQDFRDEWYDDVPASGWDIPYGAAGIPCTAGSSTTGVDLVLAPGAGASISGRVTSDTGEPVEFPEVEVYTGTGVRRRPDSWSTGSDGSYELFGVLPGTYYVRTDITDGSYSNEWYDGVALGSSDVPPPAATPVVVTKDSGTQGIDFVLSPGDGGRIRGVVQDDGGGALRDADVEAYDSGGVRVASESSNAKGEYSLGVPPGTYYVKAEAPSGICVLDEWYGNVIEDGTPGIPGGALAVVVASRGSVSDVDFSLSSGAEIRGTVTDESGVPIGEDLWVRVYDADNNQLRSCDPDAKGAYKTAVPAGTYFVRADAGSQSEYADQWYDSVAGEDGTIPPGATPIVATVGQTYSGIDFALPKAAVLSGTVTDPDGVSLNEATVRVYDPATNVVGSDRVNAIGAYRVGVRPGLYYLRADPPSTANCRIEWRDNVPAENGAIPAGAAPTSVVSLGTTHSGLDFVLDWASGVNAIGGQVLDPWDNPVAGLPVSAYAQGGALEATSSTLGNGRYTLSALPQGTYYLRTEGADQHIIDEWYDDILADGAGIPGGAQGITVETNTVRDDLDFVVVPVQIVQVAAEAGAPCIEWVVRGGVDYQVQCSTSLVNGVVWSNAPSGAGQEEQSHRTALTNGFLRYLDSGAGPTTKQYYRVRTD